MRTRRAAGAAGGCLQHARVHVCTCSVGPAVGAWAGAARCAARLGSKQRPRCPAPRRRLPLGQAGSLQTSLHSWDYDSDSWEALEEGVDPKARNGAALLVGASPAPWHPWLTAPAAPARAPASGLSVRAPLVLPAEAARAPRATRAGGARGAAAGAQEEGQAAAAAGQAGRGAHGRRGGPAGAWEPVDAAAGLRGGHHKRRSCAGGVELQAAWCIVVPFMHFINWCASTNTIANNCT